MAFLINTSLTVLMFHAFKREASHQTDRQLIEQWIKKTPLHCILVLYACIFMTEAVTLYWSSAYAVDFVCVMFRHYLICCS
jgi:hypothetical protein